MISPLLSADEAKGLHGAVVESGLPHGEPRAFVAAARSALDLGRVVDAIALARAALALSPTNASAWVVLGDAAWLGSDVAAARNAWEEALSLDDKDFGTAVSCARAQLLTGAPSAARALLTFVLTRTTSDELRSAALTLLDAVDAAVAAITPSAFAGRS